jgi:hypothetical protein
MIDAQNSYAGGFAPHSTDGFEDQKVLLTRISRELDEYFSLRTLGSIRL